MDDLEEVISRFTMAKVVCGVLPVRDGSILAIRHLISFDDLHLIEVCPHTNYIALRENHVAVYYWEVGRPPVKQLE